MKKWVILFLGAFLLSKMALENAFQFVQVDRNLEVGNMFPIIERNTKHHRFVIVESQ